MYLSRDNLINEDASIFRNCRNIPKRARPPRAVSTDITQTVNQIIKLNKQLEKLQHELVVSVADKRHYRLFEVTERWEDYHTGNEQTTTVFVFAESGRSAIHCVKKNLNYPIFYGDFEAKEISRK